MFHIFKENDINALEIFNLLQTTWWQFIFVVFHWVSQTENSVPSTGL